MIGVFFVIAKIQQKNESSKYNVIFYAFWEVKRRKICVGGENFGREFVDRSGGWELTVEIFVRHFAKIYLVILLFCHYYLSN